MSSLPIFDPHPTLETEPFWTAAASGRLVLPKCDNCGNIIWYPRRFCPVCHHASVTWIDASGRGTVYSFTVVRKGRGPWREAAPYVAAYVELEEGPRMMTNIIEVEPSAVAIGMPVEVVFDRSETAAIPRFRPAR